MPDWSPPLNEAWTPLSFSDAGPGVFRCGMCRTAKWCDTTAGWMRWKPKVLGARSDGQLVCPGCVSTAHLERERREAIAAVKYLGS